MKHQFSKLVRALLLLTFLLPLINTQAQVTVGLNEEPVQGAVLQLKDIAGVTNGEANAKRGLMLPRVTLKGVEEAKIGASTDFTTDKDIHTGLMVYNLYDNTDIESEFGKLLCPGPYVWTGSKWDRLWEPCKFQYSGLIDCVNNISSITIGVCQTLYKLGSFQLTAYDNAVITIKDGDVLGSVLVGADEYKIVAQKIVSGSGDTDTYTVNKDNSPMDINVIVQGPSSTTPRIINIPIDLSGKITGGKGVNIEGCPYSVVEITKNYLIADPTPLIFTSGLDGLSRGYQAFKDDKGYFNFSAQGLAFSSFIENDFLVRPWGIKGIPYQGKTGGGANVGTPGYVADNASYWPLRISWQPHTSDVKVIDSPSTPPQLYKEPKFDLVYNNANLPHPGSTTDPCGYITYELDDEQTGATPIWEQFIKMYPIDQARIFADGIESFTYNRPYSLSKKVTLKQSTGASTTLDIRQIHYGAEIITTRGTFNPVGKYYEVHNFDPANENYEFKFQIKSNVKWKCNYMAVRVFPGAIDVLDDAINLDTTGQDSFGPEEDAYGEPRTREVTVKFRNSPVVPSGGYINIFITLDDPKLLNDTYAGQEYLYIHLYND